MSRRSAFWEPHVGAKERSSLLSLKVWNEGLLEGGGVAENLWFGSGTFFPCHLVKSRMGTVSCRGLVFGEQQGLGTAGWGLAGCL